MSIRARLLGLVLALALPLVAIAAAALYHAYRSEQHAIRTLLQDTSRALALAADREVDRARTILDIQSHSLSLAQDNLQGFHSRASRALQETGQWMWLAKPDGQILLSTAFPFGRELPPSSRAEAYRRMTQTVRAELSGVYVGGATGRTLLAMEIPVIRDGEVRYVLGIGIPVESFQKLTEGMNLPSTWIATITDRNGRIVSRSRDAQHYLNTPAPEPIASLIRNAPEGVIGTDTVDSVPVLAAFARAPEYGLVAAVGYPQAEITRVVYRSLAWLLVFVAAGAGGLVAALLLARNIARSIRVLGTLAEETDQQTVPRVVHTGMREVDAVGNVLSISDWVRRKSAAREREGDVRLRHALEAGRLGEWEYDLASGVLTSSATCKANFGRGPEDTFSYEDLVAAIHPEDREDQAEAVADAVAARSSFEIEYRVIWPDASEHWIQVRGGWFEREEVQLLIGVSQDVTQRKLADEHRELLMHELNHRVKNTLATVQSMAAMTFRSSANYEGARAAFQSRLIGMSRTHDLLTQSRWEGAHIQQILMNELEPYQDRLGQRVTLRGKPVMVGAGAALALGLAVHELATNAAKYGALSRETGRLSVRWTAVRIEGLPHLLMEWDESGGPAVEPPERQGFGSRLLQRAITQDLQGDIKMHFAPSGLRCVITFSVQPSESDSQASDGERNIIYPPRLRPPER